MSITLRHIKGSPLTHEEMDDNFSALTGSYSAGDGLTGGGDKIDDLVFNVGQGDGIQVNSDAIQVDSTVARRNSANIFTGNQTISGSLFVTGSFEHTGIINLKSTPPPAPTSDPQSFIYSSGSEGDLYFRQTSARGTNETRLRWLEGNVYTGILAGGVVSGSAGDTTFGVTAGHGLIVTLNASTGSEDLYPIFTYVEWDDFTNVTPTYLASEDTTWLLIDSNGDLIQQGTAPTDEQYSEKITLGALIHPNNTNITLFKTFPVTSYALAQQTFEFIRVFGPIKKSGHSISAGSTSLTLDRDAGIAFALGRNYINNPNEPSLISDPAQEEATIFRYYKRGSEFVTVPNNATIDPGNYNTPDTPTGLTSVPGGKFTIQRVFYFPDQANILAVYYGRGIYNSINTAVENLDFEPFEEIENTVEQAIFLGHIVVKDNATDLSDVNQARFFQAGNFRATTVSGDGGGSDVVTSLSELTDVSLGLLEEGDLLVYNGVEWQNRQNNLTLSGSFSGSFQGSHIDVTSGSFGRVDSTSGGITILSGSSLTYTSSSFERLDSTSGGITILSGSSLTYTSSSFERLDSTAGGITDLSGSSLTYTSSSFGRLDVTGNGQVDGDLTVGGIITAQEFHTEFVSASIIYQSGSTKFGDTFDDSHNFTGSVNISGSLTMSGSLDISGSGAISGDLVVGGTVTAQEFHTEFVSASIIFQSGSTKFGDTQDDIHSFTGSIDITGSSLAMSGDITGSSNLDIAGTVDANVYSINDVVVVDSSRNITGSNAHFSGYISGSSLDVTGRADADRYSINDTIVIDTNRNVTGSNAHFSGYVSASSLDVTGRADANEYSINDTIVIDSDRNFTGSNADFSGTVDANEYSINDTIVIDSDRNFTGSNADFSGNVDVDGNITVLGNANLGDSETNDIHVIKGITSVTGSFATDDIKLDGSVISTFTGNLELNPAKIVDLKSNVTASANDFKIQHTGANNFTLTSDNGNVLVENSTFSGDDVTIPGNLAVNGGDITTTDATANIFNANATSLSIGGAATTLELGASTGTTSINNDLTVDGNATFGDAEADRIDIRGQIIALSGSNTVIEQRSTGVGSLRIQSIGSTNNKLILSASGDIEVKQSVTMTDLGTSIQSSGYQSGFAGQGFDINFGEQASAEFDNLTVRGSMRVFELIINQVRATNGSLFVSSTGKVDSVVDLGGGNFALLFDTGSGTVGHGFTEDDVIRAQQVNRDAIANAGQTQSLNDNLVFRSDLTVTSVQDLKIVTASLQAGSTPPSSSFDFVRLGNTSNINRQGNVYLTSDDNYAPFIDVVDGITSHTDWNNSATAGGVKVRVGKIDGINSPIFGDLDGYGMWASGSVYLEGSINATAGLIGGWAITPGYIQSNNIRLQSSGSDGGELISIGQNASMTGNGVFLSGSGDFNLQTDDNNFIRKSGNLLDIKSEEFSLSTGNLTISGSSTDGFISLGTLTDTSTVSNTNDGFFVSASGDVLIKGGAIADNRYIKVNSSGLEIKTDVFDLDAGQLELFGNTDSAYLKMGTLANAKDTNNSNYGVYIDHSGSLLLKSTDVDKNYIRVSGSGFIDINADKFKLQAGSPVSLVLTEADGGFLALGGSNYTDSEIALSGSGEAKFGNINVDGRSGGKIFSGDTNLASTVIAEAGIFLSGSGEFNFIYDSKNFIRRVGTSFSIGATTASIDTPTLDINTAAGGTIALGDTDSLYPPNLSNPGIFLSGSGEFNFEVGDNNRITRTGSLLEIRSTDFIIETNTFDVSTEDGGFFRLGPGIVVGEDTLFPSMTNKGIFMSGSGEFNFEQDDDNRLTFDDGVFELRATTASLSGSNIEIITTNLEIDTSTFTLNTDNGGTIALGEGTPSLSAAGIFLSGSGEFNFQQDPNNRITFDNQNLEIRATTASLSGSNIDIITTNLEIDTSTFALNTDAGGTIALGDTPPTNLSSNGIFLSGSGEFNFQSGSNDRLTFNNGTLELRATDVVLKGDTVEISGSNFHLLNGNITASNVDLTGKITATSGEIGGFTISEDALAGNNFFISGSASNNEFFISSSNFNVKANGDVTGSQVLFTGGKISGSSISFDVTDFVAKGDTVEISGSGFHLQNGNITASNANIQGILSSSEGNIGGWTLGNDNLNNGNVYLSNSGSTRGLYIDAATGPNRLQVGEFDTVTPSPTTLSEGTRTTSISTGTKLSVNAYSPPSFTLNAISSTADSGSINIPINGSVSTGDTVYVSQPVDFSYLFSDSSIASVTDFATVKVEITSGSANTVVAGSSITRTNEYPIEKTLSVSYYYTGSATLSSGDLDVKISYSSRYNRTTDPGNLTEVTVSGTTIQKDSARVNITNSQALFYQGPGRKFEWTPGGIVFEGGEITVEDITTDDATITGRLTANTDVIITSSNTNVIAIDARDANQDGLIWGIASDGDPYFAPIDNGTYDFSSELRYRLDLERWDVESKLYVGSNLEVNTSITSSDLQLTGLSSITATSLLGVDGSGNVGTTTSAISSYTNGVDNRILTSTGATGINGEANLTFDGSELDITGSVRARGYKLYSSDDTGNFLNTGYNTATSRSFTAPYPNGTADFAKEFGYSFDNGLWYFDDKLTIGHSNSTSTTYDLDVSGDAIIRGHITSSTFQTAGNTVIKGNLTVEGDTNLEASVVGHIDISGATGTNYLDGNVIQNIFFDEYKGPGNGYGHVISVQTASLDDRYLQASDLAGYVQKSGDTMTGKLTISSEGLEVTGSTDIKGQVSVNSGTSDKVLDLRSTDNFATIYLSDDTTGSGNKGEAIRRLGDTLSLHSSGSKTLIISGSNVGINDDTPEETLTVAGTAKVTGLVTGKAFRTLSSNNDYSLITRNDAAASFPLYVQNRIVSSDSKIARFAHSGNAHNDGQTVLELAGEKSYFDNTKLGIDTANPEYLLDVGAENVDNPTDFIRMNPTNGNGDGTTNTLGTGLIWKPHYTNYTKRSAGVVQVGEGNFFRSGLAFYTNNSADQTTDWQERMRIDKDGNVGINVTEPSATLHVDGDAIVTGRITAEEFHTEFVSASIVYQSGSTKFGNTSDDIHSFSGSLRVTGSGDHYITDGNVGIGTSTSIQEKLHLNGGTDDVALRIDTTDADPKIRFTTLTQQDWSLGIDYDDAGKFKIAESGFPGTNDALVIDVNRKVGIGTSDPVKNFEVEVNNSNTTVTSGNSLSGGSAGSGILIRNSNTTSGTYANLDFRANNADGRIAYQYKGTTNVGDFHFITDNTGTPKSSMIIKNDGKVGIGTDPTYELDVAGDIGVNQYIYHNDDANTYIRFQPDDISLVANGNNLFRVDGGVNGTPKEIVVNESGADTDFRVESDTVAAALFVTGSTGNVGIGTTSPNEKVNIDVGDGGANTTVGLKVGGLSNYPSLELGIEGNYTGVIRSYGNDLKYYSGHWRTIGNTATENHSHFWYTSKAGSSNWSSAKMTLNEDGNLGIGNTSPTETLTVEGNISASGDLIVDEITAVNINVSGTLTATSIIETSTRELKNNIITLDSQEEIVDKLQPVSYTWKQDGVEDFGLIAEDVEEIAPHLVSRDDNGNPTGIKYSKLSVLLLDVVKKQSTLIEDLNKRITKLEDKT